MAATPTAPLLAALLLAAAFCLPTLASAQPPSPQPKIDSDLRIELNTKLFEPWGNGSSAVEGSSFAIGASVARVVLGPCVYRALHWHAAAWEVFTLVHGRGPVRSVMVAPGAGEQQVRRDTLHHGETIAYPAGWVHYQLNDGCRNATALLVWNAVHSGGVNNVPQQLGALPGGYTGAVFSSSRGGDGGGEPLHEDFWLRDAECAKRCGLDDEGDGDVKARRAVDDPLSA